MIPVPLAAFLLLAAQDPPGLTPAAAAPIFKEHRALARKDGGKLWGRSLAGPLLLADPEAGVLIASEADGEGRLHARNGVRLGPMPEGMQVANTATTWAGTRWTMLRWPLGSDTRERRVLLAHESFHRIQPELGLWPASMPACTHLETREGRYWLRLELRAWRDAIQEQGARRAAAVRAALAFRARRRALLPGGAAGEVALEAAEGLAEYTGVKVALDPRTAVQRTAARLVEADRSDHFARSFAYVTGPALGLLLDGAKAGWRKGLEAGEDLAGLLGTGRSEEADRLAAAYAGATLAQEEDARESRRLARVAELRRLYVEGPVLRVPMGRITFNPTLQEAHAGLGIFNPTLTLSAPWGTLTVEGGSLLAEDWSHVTVQAPTHPQGSRLSGPGWTLEIREGWALVPGSRSGDWEVRKP